MLKSSNLFSQLSNKLPNEEVIDSINLKLGFGLYVTEKDYDKWIKGNEYYIFDKFRFEWILLVREGELDFYHYGPSNLKEINPSTFENNENLSFCEGVYCFNVDSHNPITPSNGRSLYRGKYVGKYLECVCDFVSDDLPKDFGSSKEYVLLTDKPVKVEVFN